MPHPHPTPTDTASIVERLESRIASGDTGLAADAKAEIQHLQAELKKARELTIEECARVSDGYYSEDNEVSKHIRALKGSTQTS